MNVGIVKDGWLHMVVVVVMCGLPGMLCRIAGYDGTAWIFFGLGAAGVAFMAFFFRHPDRDVPGDPGLVVAGADGKVRSVEIIENEKYLGGRAVRVSVYLSPFNVHVNRAPLAGKVSQLDYIPGKHLLTACNAASEHNEHSSIYIEGEEIRCLVHQIVGPVVRRVVYWLSLGQRLAKGEPIGIMKFGSRLDVYLPADDVDLLVQPGEKVLAGVTPLARIKLKDVS